MTSRSRRWLGKWAQTGEDPYLLGKPSIGASHAQLLIGNRFRMASRPVGSHLSVGPGALLRIGDDVWIAHGAAIASHERVEIGDGTRIGPFVIIMDSNFHRAGDQSEQHDCKPVVIGRNCRIGSRVTITRGARIGDGAQILAGSVVSAVIPPGVCAAGARARIVGRAGEISSLRYGAAVLLPDILRQTLALQSTPDLDDRPIGAELWTDARIHDSIDAVRSQLGLELDFDALRELRSFADIAALVQRSLGART
jgi:acetyltransferase-like isoleucine patch superfamily enzyme